MPSESENLFRDVLVVDDDPATVRIISRFVEMEGYVPTPATNGTDALKILKNRQFHFLLSDLDMPRMGGLALCRALRCLELPRYVYTVVLADSNTEHLHESLRAGADDFIKKPVDRSELIARMIAGKRVLNMESKLRFLVSYDPLTNVLNRRTFFEQVEARWREQFGSDRQWACVMVDIDRFKKINDSYGHIAGDRVLRGVADILKATFAKTSIIGRYGGEEFCIAVHGMTERDAIDLSNSARNHISESRFEVNGIHIPTTASFGVAHRPFASLSPIDLVNLADMSLLKAKRAGRNRVHVAEEKDAASPFTAPLPSPIG